MSKEERKEIASFLNIKIEEVNDDMVGEWRKVRIYDTKEINKDIVIDPTQLICFTSEGAEEYYFQLTKDGYPNKETLDEVVSCFGKDSVKPHKVYRR